jgi:hypothetical protein
LSCSDPFTVCEIPWNSAKTLGNYTRHIYKRHTTKYYPRHSVGMSHGKVLYTWQRFLHGNILGHVAVVATLQGAFTTAGDARQRIRATSTICFSRVSRFPLFSSRAWGFSCPNHCQVFRLKTLVKGSPIYRHLLGT